MGFIVMKYEDLENELKPVFDSAEAVRKESHRKYKDSFLKCYEEFGKEYLFGEILNCLYRAKNILDVDPDLKNIESFENVIVDGINWFALLHFAVTKKKAYQSLKTVDVSCKDEFVVDEHAPETY